MSPDAANYAQKQMEETPETLAMYDADSSQLTSTSVDTEESSEINYQKATGTNLQSTFAASANKENQAPLAPVSQQLGVEANQ